MLRTSDAPHSLKEIIHKDSEKISVELMAHMRKNISYQTSFRLKSDTIDGASLFATFSPVVSSDDTLEEILMIAQDVSALEESKELLNKRVEEQTSINLEQKNMMFQQAKMASMGEMIGNIAHQWRQPLNAIGLLVQDLEDAYAYDELNEQYLHGMVEKSMNQINFMSKTIVDFRNFFQPNKKKREFDIIDAVNKTLDIVGQTLIKSEIELSVNRETDNEILFFGYQNELQQVILNLINNAKDSILEKNGDASREKWIRINIRDSDEQVTLSVSDNGEGIPENILERIFEPYYTTKEEGKGTGVGLYMSKMIIEQSMGGAFCVENGSAGATFSFTLPKETQAGV